VTAIPPSATAMNAQRSVSRYGTSGRTAVCVSARALRATSSPAAPSVATPAAPPPFIVRLSASTSRAAGLEPARACAPGGHHAPRGGLLGGAPLARPAGRGRKSDGRGAGRHASSRAAWRIFGPLKRAEWALTARPRLRACPSPRALRGSNPEGNALPREVRAGQATVPLSRRQEHRPPDARRQGPHCRGPAQAVGTLARRARRWIGRRGVLGRNVRRGPRARRDAGGDRGQGRGLRGATEGAPDRPRPPTNSGPFRVKRRHDGGWRGGRAATGSQFYL